MITGYGATDSIALGVTDPTGTKTELLTTAITGQSYANVLAAATGVITNSVTADIVVADNGTTTWVFADTNADNVIDTVIQLTGTGLGITSTDFVA